MSWLLLQFITSFNSGTLWRNGEVAPVHCLFLRADWRAYWIYRGVPEALYARGQQRLRPQDGSGPRRHRTSAACSCTVPPIPMVASFSSVLLAIFWGLYLLSLQNLLWPIAAGDGDQYNKDMCGQLGHYRWVDICSLWWELCCKWWPVVVKGFQLLFDNFSQDTCSRMVHASLCCIPWKGRWPVSPKPVFSLLAVFQRSKKSWGPQPML